MQKLRDSEERAEAQLSQLYGRRVATVIVLISWLLTRILLIGLQIPMREACDGLGILIANNIISRAVNGLPAQGVERRERENIKNLLPR